MTMFNEKTFYDLSLLSYFDFNKTGISVREMVTEILEDDQLESDYASMVDFKNNYEVLAKIRVEDYEDMTVKEIYNDNINSGVVYYVFETKEALIFAFRGSESLDYVHGKTAWQDWKDNFRMFLKDPTYQQILTLHRVQNTNIDKPFYMCGHSKGGNLALYVALTMREDLLDRLEQVYSFNAPGITKDIFDLYRNRAEDSSFTKKLTIFQCENDCVSSFFENLTEPIYIRSSIPCTNMQELYFNHNLHAMNFDDNLYIRAEKKTAIPKFFYHFINDFFVNLKEERRKKVVDRMDGYFDSGLSIDDLYKAMILDLSRYISLFEDIPDEEMATITFQELMERRKTKNIMAKVKELQPKEKIQTIADSIISNNPITKLNEIDVKEITQGLMDNYELLVKEKTKEFQSRIAENNEKIVSAIKSIRNRDSAE